MHNVSEVKGTLIYDSSFSQNKNSVIKIKLEEVQNIFGNKVSARGVVTLVGKDKINLSAGSGIVAQGHFSEDLFIFDSVTVYKKGKVQVLREKLISLFEKRLLGEEADNGSLLCIALLLGRTQDYEFNLRQKAAESGVLHVLALSGMHLSILSRLCLLVFGKKKTGKTIRFLVLSFFVFIAGPRASLVRAYLMYLLHFLGPCESLIAAFLIHVFIFPYQVSDLGFIYGYCAMAGLVFIRPFLERKFKVYLPSYLAGLLCSTLSAILLTAPIQRQWHVVCLLAAPVSGFLAMLSMAGGFLILMFGRNALTVGFVNAVYHCFDSCLSFFATFGESGFASFSVLIFVVLIVSISSHFLKRVV